MNIDDERFPEILNEFISKNTLISSLSSPENLGTIDISKSLEYNTNLTYLYSYAPNLIAYLYRNKKWASVDGHFCQSISKMPTYDIEFHFQ